MADQSITFTPSGPPETVLDAEPAAARDALRSAIESPEGERRAAVAAVVAQWPRYLDGWARLGRQGRDEIERYAAYRVGYHRGLDRCRAAGWRGSGYVRWSHPENRGFLRCLAGLADAAGAIGETDEQDRCAQFLRQLDPAWPPADFHDEVTADV
ncbi:MAG TPA: DUF3151 family protein [Acidimicrobiales bacterium]|jgi:hypothetical protein|nr:DUF3151 family protein [Acidimicrobiales bacterium]